MRKGQIFTVGAVIFSSLILIASITLIPSDFDQNNNIFRFYDNARNEQVDIINEQVKENYSAEKVKEGLYIYNRFVNTTASRKGMDYFAFQAALLPGKEKAVFVNYRSKATSFTFEDNSESSHTVNQRQFLIEDITDTENYTLESSELNINETFKTTDLTLVSYVRINNDRENWENHFIR